jgi:predicted  nucleic acid-binding Zn-ribbon protein
VTLMERLLLVQQHDCLIRNFERELRDIPLRKTETEAKANGHRQAVADSEAQLKKQLAEIKGIETEIGSRNDKIIKLRQQQMTLKTNKEFKAMEDEIKTVEADIRGLEDKQLESMVKLDSAKTHVQEAKAELAKEDAVLQGLIQTLNMRVSEVEKRLAEEKVVRGSAAEGIDSRAMLEYQSILSRRDLAIVAIQDGSCGGCHLKLPAFVAHEARRNQALVKCNFCGRILH